MNEETKQFGNHLFTESGKQVDDSNPVFVSADEYGRILNSVPPQIRFASGRLIEKGIINVFANGKCYAIALPGPVDALHAFAKG